MKKYIILLFILSALSLFANEKKSVLVMPLKGLVETDSKSVTEMLTSMLSSKKIFKVISVSTEINSIEKGLSKENYNEYENIMIDIAKKNNADYVVVGSVNKFGSNSQLHIKMIKVDNKEVIYGDFTEFFYIDSTQKFISNICERFAAILENKEFIY